jgi:hypothetical protein
MCPVPQGQRPWTRCGRTRLRWRADCRFTLAIGGKQILAIFSMKQVSRPAKPIRLDCCGQTGCDDMLAPSSASSSEPLLPLSPNRGEIR